MSRLLNNPLNFMVPRKSSYIDGLMQERDNSIANALELRLSCTNPSVYGGLFLRWYRLVFVLWQIASLESTEYIKATHIWTKIEGEFSWAFIIVITPLYLVYLERLHWLFNDGVFLNYSASSVTCRWWYFSLTHLLLPHICVSESVQHWFR